MRRPRGGRPPIEPPMLSPNAWYYLMRSEAVADSGPYNTIKGVGGSLRCPRALAKLRRRRFRILVRFGFPGRWHLLQMPDAPQQIESTVWYRSDSDRYRLSFRCFRGHFCMGRNTCSTWRGCRHSRTYVQCSPVGMGRPVAAGEI